MSWLSRIAPAFFSASNENTLALASVKFDFALVKVEAPAEFNPLGMVLSKRRKADAEDGGYHKTARRLGALFEQLIPSTPKLVSAYGKRISEIVETPGINPEGRSSDGPFKPYVGADATALWAAATSSTAAISIYLLACLLARAWEAHEAISIWVELVTDRKKAISEAFINNNIISEASVYSARQDITRDELALWDASARQDITRDELALWDASARSWLRSADQAKMLEKNQAELILKNLDFPYPDGESAYDKVVQTWCEALHGMEELLNERPQCVLSGSVPLAILSWHLYPNMIVLGREVKNVQFNDNLFEATGTCTVGLELDSSNKAPGTKWSLTLSHLTFYGRPSPVVARNSSRIAIEEFKVVMFGSLLASWAVETRDMLLMAVKLQEIWKLLHEVEIQHNAMSSLTCLGWLEHLAQAATAVIEGYQAHDSATIQLLKFGWRRGRGLLQRSSVGGESYLKPLFGLCNPLVRLALTEQSDLECGIRYLRELSREIGLDEYEAIIAYPCHRSEKDLPSYEIASVLPLTVASNKRDTEGNLRYSAIHFRWLVPFKEHSMDVGSDEIHQRVEAICRLGERGMSLVGESHCSFSDGALVWRTKSGFPTSGPQEQLTGTRDRLGSCVDLTFRPLLSNRWLGLYVRHHFFEREQPSVLATALETTNISEGIGDLQMIRPARLYDYLMHISTSGSCFDSRTFDSRTEDIPGVGLIAQRHLLSESCYLSLLAFGLSCTVFHELPGATISTEIVTSGASLGEAPWLLLVNTTSSKNGKPYLSEPFPPLIQYTTIYELNRPQTFACLLHFETGSPGIMPEYLRDVFAISLDNSIYVAKVLLSDPGSTNTQNTVLRLTGNIGRSGISLLIGVINPQVGKSNYDYRLVRHDLYDFNRENSYKGSSLHLSLTGWSIPLYRESIASLRTVDQKVYYIESVISLRERGKYISDLDLLTFPFEQIVKVKLDACQDIDHGSALRLEDSYISIDDWEELFDPPTEGVGIIRANSNWAARLAAALILYRRSGSSNFAIVCGEHFCLKCLEKRPDIKRFSHLID